MKSIFIKLIPYLLVFAALNVIIYFISGFYKQQCRYIEPIESAIDSQSEIIFLGDSHVESIKQLDLSDNIGNLAFGADGIEEMYIKVLIMLEYNDNIKTIFIATEPQMFSDVKSPNTTFLNKYLLKINDAANVYNKSILNLITDKVPLFNDNYIKYILNEALNLIKPKTDKADRKWSLLTESERTEIAAKTGKVDHNSVMTNLDLLDIYTNIIELCKANNIKVIGIRFPVNENYINQCSAENLKKVNEYVSTLDLNANFDYSNIIKDPKYFEDEDHLNQLGIEKFSKIILEDTGVNLTN